MNASFHPFSMSLARPMETARGRIEERSGLLVRVEDGDVGWGEATPLPGWTESLADCRAALEAGIDRLDGDDPGTALDALDGSPAARHGLHLALADLDARRKGEPLHRTLGSTGSVESVPVNATVGDGDVEATVEAAESAAEAGFGCLKVKVGSRSVEDDVERLQAVRGALGDDVVLRADANGAWTPSQAREALSRFADVGVAYVEQPLAADDLDGHAALSGGPVGVALDESLVEHSAEEVLEADAADVLILKPLALGGVDLARSIALAAHEAGVDSVVTTTIDAVIARTAAVHLVASLPDPSPAGLATAEWLVEDLAPDPAPVRDGSIRVPDAPGLGVEPEWPR